VSKLRSPLFPIFLIVLVDVFGFTLVIPLLAIYAERFGATALQATLLVSVYAVCQLVASPLLGRASDRTGRKPMLLLSQVGTLVGFLVMANASALWVLYLARVIDGFTAGNLSLAQAYISDKTSAENRAKSFAIIGIAFGLGFFLGPFVTGLLAKHVGLTAPIWLAAGMSALSILCTATLLPGGPPVPQSAATNPGPGGQRLSLFQLGAYARYFKQPILDGLLAQFYCFTFCFTTFTSGIALFCERRFVWHGHPFGPAEVGYLFAFVGFLGIILQGGLIGRLVKRFGEPALVLTGFASLAVAYSALGFVHGLAWLAVVAAIASYGNGVLRPSLTSLITQKADRREQGLVLGLTQSLNSMSSIVAPALAGVLIERGLLSAWALVAAGAALLGILASRFGSSLVRRSTPAA
jgi:MFS transporter, DHA1 family, tetracycline resistance protein